MNQESVTGSQAYSNEDSRALLIMLLWNELNEVRNEYSDCGANETETDWKVQATVYAISFCVLVDVPKTPKRYGLVNSEAHTDRTFMCAKEMHRILSLIHVEFRAFANTFLPDELYEWLLLSCWQYCKRS